MSKKNNNAISNTNKDIMDMSSRKKMDIIHNQEYTEQDMDLMLLDLQRQMEQMETIHQKYYSLNAYIDRIQGRTFSNILEAKLISIFSKVLSSLHLGKEK